MIIMIVVWKYHYEITPIQLYRKVHLQKRKFFK